MFKHSTLASQLRTKLAAVNLNTAKCTKLDQDTIASLFQLLELQQLLLLVITASPSQEKMSAPTSRISVNGNQSTLTPSQLMITNHCSQLISVTQLSLLRIPLRLFGTNASNLSLLLPAQSPQVATGLMVKN